MRVALGLEEADDAHGAGLADAREVVAAEVDEHHVLGLVLLGCEQLLGVALAGRRRPGDRVQGRARALELDEGLRGGADERDPVELEEEVVGRGVDAPQRAVDGERRGARRSLGTLREDDLEGVARADVLLGAPDTVLVGLARREPLHRPGSAGGRGLLGERAVEARRHLGRIAHEHLGEAGRVVEADERGGDDEAALGQVGPRGRKRHRRLELGDVVVAEVADDGTAGRHLLLCLFEGDDPRPGAEEAVRPRRPFSTDSSRKPARSPARNRR